jgi:hypothetical protein
MSRKNPPPAYTHKSEGFYRQLEVFSEEGETSTVSFKALVWVGQAAASALQHRATFIHSRGEDSEEITASANLRIRTVRNGSQS